MSDNGSYAANSALVGGGAVEGRAAVRLRQVAWFPLLAKDARNGAPGLKKADGRYFPPSRSFAMVASCMLDVPS